MDRRSLRKFNHQQSRPDPIVPEDPQGTLGRRDRNTGKRETHLDNGGLVQSRPLFQGSPTDKTKVQLNTDTGTADWRSVDRQKEEARRRKRRKNPWDVDDSQDQANKRRRQRNSPGYDIQDPSQNNPDNTAIGKCPVCTGRVETQIDCQGGDAQITFTDATVQDIPTPAVLVYGAKATFQYSDGSLGSITIDSCGTATIQDDRPGLTDAIDGYGSLMYRQLASDVSIGGLVTSGIREFHLYKDGCTVTMIGIDLAGTKFVVGSTTCNNVAGTYTALTGKTSLVFGDQTAYDINPSTVAYECVIRGYRFCQKYTVSWVGASDGRLYSIDSCAQIGYALTDAAAARFLPPARPLPGYSLVYNSGIPRDFTVSNGVLTYPSTKGYFQIYQNLSSPCEYDVVGVAIANDGYTYETIYTGACGFEVTLGGYLATTFLQVFNAQGTLLFQTSDYVPGAIKGCVYTNGSFSGDCRTEGLARVLVFEKSLDSGAETPIDVATILCGG